MTDTTRTAVARDAIASAIHDTLYHDMDPKAGFRWYWQTDEGTPNDLAAAILRKLADSGYTLVPSSESVTPASTETLRLLEAAIESSQPDCRWTDDPDDIVICEEHSEIVIGPEGCEDSPRWWKAKAIDVIRAALSSPVSSEEVK